MDKQPTRCIAVVEIRAEWLLKVMDFEKGTIHRVYTENDYISPPTFHVVLEHQDLPETPISERLPQITPEYQTHFNEYGVITKVERVYPDKKLPGGQISK